MEKVKLKFTSFYFLCYLIVFVLDCLVNFYIKLPVFVSFTILFIPFTLLYIKSNKVNEFNLLTVFISLLLTSTLINVFRFNLSLKNISDLIFILIFALTIVLYNNNKNELSHKNINRFSVICLIMFYVTFLGVDNTRWGNTLNSGSHDLEYLRSYKQGLFRISHIAAYFFAFLGFYYFYIYKTFKKRKNLLFSFVMFFSVILVGSRAPLVAILMGFLIASFRVKYIKYLFFIFIALFFIISNIDIILELTKGSVVFQYFSIFKTIVTNFARLSRIIIWTSFFEELLKFNLIDVFFGRGVNNALVINEKKGLGEIWFHNDFLSIFYSFGIINFILYIIFFINLFLTNKMSMNNTIIRTLFFTIIFLAFFNGFYLYYVMFPLYIFFKLISIEKTKMINFTKKTYD